MILEIVKYPDPRLKEISEEVKEVTPELRRLAEDMAETMYSAKGVGLAAPQVGVKSRMIVVDPSGPDERNELRVLINPKVTPLDDDQVREAEGCLSVRLNYRSEVPRYCRVHLSASDLDGNGIEEDLEGFEAIILQHECDHLDGKLFIDRISRLKRSLYDTKIKKWLKYKEEEKE